MLKIKRITIEDFNGTIFYLEEPTEITQLLQSFPKTIAWKKEVDEIVLRKKYFSMLDALVKNLNTGYTKTDIRLAIKPLILSKFKDCPDYFKEGRFELSIAQLNSHGLIAAIEQLKVMANDIYGYVFN